MRTQEDRAADLLVGRLIEAYDEYLDFLKSADDHVAGLLYAHGYRCPDDQVRRGEELRNRIAGLKRSVLGR
jgi:hypothetical protein